MRSVASTALFALSITTALATTFSPQVLLSDQNNRNVSVSLFAELEELARLVDVAYCVGGTSLGISRPFQCLSRCSEFPGFELVTTWDTGLLLSDSCGYIALDHEKERIIVAFRGTYSVANTVVDLSTIPQEYVPYLGDEDDQESNSNRMASTSAKCANCTVHMGFHRAWRHTRSTILPELQEQILLQPSYQVHLVGHSLGGAVAALASLDLQARGWDPIVTTFGSPRIGNIGLAHYLDEKFGLTASDMEPDAVKFRRLTHVDDPVPLLPLTEWGFAAHAGEIFISKPSLSPDVQDLTHCTGDNDQQCIARQDSTTANADGLSLHRRQLDLLASVRDEIADVKVEPWGIPSRYKLWQLFFAHRDYFWRLGLCVPGGDPLGGGGLGLGDGRRDQTSDLR